MELQNGNITDLTEEFQSLDKTAMKMVALVSCLTVAFNVGVIIVAVCRRTKLKSILHVLYLSFSDAILGIGSICVSQVGRYSGRVTYFEECVPFFAVYLISQGATMYHVLAIAVHRFLLIKRVNIVLKDKIQPVYYISVIWFVCCIVNSVPFIKWGDHHSKMTECSMNSMFTVNYRRAMGWFAVVYYIPLIFTNIVYVTMYIMMYKAFNKVTSQIQQDIRMSGHNSVSQPISSEADDNINYQEYAIRQQRRAFGAIGIILLLLNVCTTPLIVGVLLEANISSIVLTRTTKFIFLTIMVNNSLMNPFIYVIRFETFRRQLKAVFKECVLIVSRVLPTCK